MPPSNCHTIIFTALLAIVACLWLLSLVGVLDIEADSADGLLDDALEPLNLSEVPATILLTVIGLAGWFVSVLASVFLLDSRTGMALAILSIIVGVGAAVFALGFTMWIAPKLGQMALSDEVAGDGAAVAMPQAVQDQHSRAKRIRAQPEDSQRPTKSATAPAIFPTESGTL